MKKSIFLLLALSAISVSVHAVQNIYVFNKSGATINCIVNNIQQSPITIRNNTKEKIGIIAPSLGSYGVMNLKVMEQLAGRSMEAGMYQTKPMDFTSLIDKISSESSSYPNKDAVITIEGSLSPNNAKIQWITVGRTIQR